MPARQPQAPAPRGRRSKPVAAARRRQSHPRGAAVLDALLRGRTWIALVFVLLAGIVFLNVNLLRINREIAASADKSRAVKLENAQLRTNIARLGSSERIQRVAAQRGLVLPAPGEVRYLKSAPQADARKAAARLKGGEAAPTQPQPDAQPPAAAPLAAQPQAPAQPPG